VNSAAGAAGALAGWAISSMTKSVRFFSVSFSSSRLLIRYLTAWCCRHAKFHRDQPTIYFSCGIKQCASAQRKSTAIYVSFIIINIVALNSFSYWASWWGISLKV
jgi:hypothetical protein